MKKYVIDTSVAVKWFSEDENEAGNAIQLRQQLLDGFCSITVPDLLIYELANALKHNPNLATKDIKAALDSVFDMDIDIRKTDSLVVTHAIDIAFRFRVTVYDAYFMALAQLEKNPFITADYKFLERVKGFKDVIKLSEI
jgi:predicted nucleic acid-binding protein